MKTLARLLAVLLLVVPVFAQVQSPGATLVQQAQPYVTCNQTNTATGAANTAVTATLTPPSGQYVYLCSIDIQEVANAAVTGAAGPAPIFTTTNLPTNLVWWGNNATQGTGQNTNVVSHDYPSYLKSSVAGTAFTIATSAGQSTDSVRINVAAFFAP